MFRSHLVIDDNPGLTGYLSSTHLPSCPYLPKLLFPHLISSSALQLKANDFEYWPSPPPPPLLLAQTKRLNELLLLLSSYALHFYYFYVLFLSFILHSQVPACPVYYDILYCISTKTGARWSCGPPANYSSCWCRWRGRRSASCGPVTTERVEDLLSRVQTFKSITSQASSPVPCHLITFTVIL